MYELQKDAESTLALSECPALAGSWKDALHARYRSLSAEAVS
jgi:hypothetical protein